MRVYPKVSGLSRKGNIIFAITRWEATQSVMATKLNIPTKKKNGDTTAPSGRELYHLQFSLQAASSETFGYTLLSTTAVAILRQVSVLF
jgi:hypothetical protein